MHIPPGAIAREWSALVETARVDEYLAHMRTTSYDDYVTLDGNLRTSIHARDLGDGRTEVRVLSVWRDLAAIRAMSGDDLTRPLSYPDDDEYLLAQPQRVRLWTVRHHERGDGGMQTPVGAVVREAIALVETVRVDEFIVHMRATKHDDYSGSPGIIRSGITTRDLGDGRSEIRVTSIWEDVESIHHLVGDDISIALAYPDDTDYLLEMPRRVLHWVVR
ncbi:hypothetical protein [Agrococcus jejuensis]|uniref:hypothetical protein n=1 Tax=Agrococcus jejuensis TaxID=399736 RepID=UPI000B84A123|nr:hypothetical protein [Agrococcus jejuensis]